MTIAAPQIPKFLELIQSGIDSWTEAGKVLVEMYNADASIILKISREHRHVTKATLEAFLRIGRMEIHPYLIMDPSPGAKRLAGLPYDEQLELYEDGVACVVTKKNCAPKSEIKKVQDLNWQEIERVFDGDRVRSVKEQMTLVTFKPKPVVHTAQRRCAADREQSEMRDAPLSDVIVIVPGSPKAKMESLLEGIQISLMQVREALVMINVDHPQDRHVTTALGAVSRMRLALNEGEIYQ